MAEILAVETGCKNSMCIWDYGFQFPLALVFGNEALGISEELIDVCDAPVYMPLFGRKTSINVGNSAAAVLYFVLSTVRIAKDRQI
jgi:tRNA G18 (ribose-2'-O)-methylase SpoU